jgi:hypothetical protein
MSFSAVPDEVLDTILRLALVSDSSITTSVRAHNTYQTHLDAVTLMSERPHDGQEKYLNAKLSTPVAPRKQAISPLLLGTCRRWYRLGAPFFYGSNSFVLVHSEIGTFARQIRPHSSLHIKILQLVIRPDDVALAPKTSWLRKSYLRNVEKLSLTMAKRRTLKKDLDANQKRKEWMQFTLLMRRTGRKVRENMERQKQQGGHWKVSGSEEWGFVHANAESGVLSSTWTLARIPMPSKYSKARSVQGTATKEITGEKDAVEEDAERLQPSVEGSEGSIACGGGTTETKVQCKTTFDAGLPTPDPTPSPAPEETQLPLPNWGTRA